MDRQLLAVGLVFSATAFLIALLCAIVDAAMECYPAYLTTLCAIVAGIGGLLTCIFMILITACDCQKMRKERKERWGE